MHKATVLLYLVLTIGAYGADSSTSKTRTLLGSARASSSTSASSTGGRVATKASATSTGGTASAVARATSEAFAEVESKVEDYFEYVRENLKRKSLRESKEEYCESAVAVIEKELVNVGRVTAKAYTDALAKVQIRGEGQACASSEGEARAQASGFSKILAEAIADASLYLTKSKASAAVEVEINAIAKAFSKAFAVACLEDTGSVTAVQTSFANAMVQPIAVVTIAAFAGVDCSDVEAFSEAMAQTAAETKEQIEAESTGEVIIEGKGQGEAGGDAFAAGGELKACAAKYKKCCKLLTKGETVCECETRKKVKKCNAHYVPVSKTIKVPFWEDTETKPDSPMQCTCPATSVSQRVIV